MNKNHLPYPTIRLKAGKEHSLKRYHPWVFSGALDGGDAGISEGDTVQVTDHKGNFLGIGHSQMGSIAVRIINFKPTLIDQDFWVEKLTQALQLRRGLNLGLPAKNQTNAYRLCFAEGDGLPGLIIDIFEKTAILQTYTLGMHLAKAEIVAALQTVYQQELNTIYDKSAETMAKNFDLAIENQFLLGTQVSAQISENGHQFNIDWIKGQKTGFFIDQRENRELIQRYSHNRRVLNTFCYSGGFSVYAAAGGANCVHSIDISQGAIELCKNNLSLNGYNPDSEQYKCIAIDTFDHLKTSGEMYDLIVLDPPAFAKSRKVSHNAVVAYKRLNYEAMKHLAPGGLLFTFSCSQVINRELFNHTIHSAAIDAGRTVRVLHQLGQAPDHPINIFNPEGEYLKGLVLSVY